MNKYIKYLIESFFDNVDDILETNYDETLTVNIIAEKIEDMLSEYTFNTKIYGNKIHICFIFDHEFLDYLNTTKIFKDEKLIKELVSDFDVDVETNELIFIV